MPTIIIIPETDIDGGNQWAAALLGDAGSEADLLTFGPVNFTRNGVNFAVASYNDQFDVGTKGRGLLTRPAWDTGNIINMGAATNFQSRLNYRDPSEAAGMNNPQWQNFPNMFDAPDPWVVLNGGGFSPIGG